MEIVIQPGGRQHADKGTEAAVDGRSCLVLLRDLYHSTIFITKSAPIGNGISSVPIARLCLPFKRNTCVSVLIVVKVIIYSHDELFKVASFVYNYKL